MKNLLFFKTSGEYRAFITSEIIRSPIFHAHPFYRGLINYIIDHRAPIFFSASEECEHAHFTQYFNFVLMRDIYEDDVLRDLYFMHDFMHMALHNPLNVRDYTFKKFCDIVLANEYVAANETETITYYRVPELRRESMSQTILYDLLIKKYRRQPSVQSLINMRRDIMFDKDYHGLDVYPQAEQVFSFIRRFRENNELWCKLWYDNFPNLPPSPFASRHLLLLTYEKILHTYQPLNDEGRYRALVTHNINTALAMRNMKFRAEKFSDCRAGLELLEGNIILKNTAQAFHRQYTASKKPAAPYRRSRLHV